MDIAIACGGTGGHVFPGLAVADVLGGRGHDVTLWLSGRAAEQSSLGDRKLSVVRVDACGFPSGPSLRSVAVAWGLLRSVGRCRRLMRAARPAAVLGMGSYASVGPVLAARTLGIPAALHEANAVPGRAVAFLSRFGCPVAVAFRGAQQYLRGRCEFTGFPVRTDLAASRGPDTSRAQRPFTVLIMGGSQGAHRINESAVEALCLLARDGDAPAVVHLAGRADEETVRRRYEAAGVRHRVRGFLQDMGAAYRAADLAVARAGAATCAELAACGVPALLVPLPSARRDHQAANARELAAAGAVDVLSENDLAAGRLAGYIRDCARDPDKLGAMACALGKLAEPRAAERIADLVLSLRVM